MMDDEIIQYLYKDECRNDGKIEGGKPNLG